MVMGVLTVDEGKTFVAVSVVRQTDTKFGNMRSKFEQATVRAEIEGRCKKTPAIAKIECALQAVSVVEFRNKRKMTGVTQTYGLSAETDRNTLVSSWSAIEPILRDLFSRDVGLSPGMWMQTHRYSFVGRFPHIDIGWLWNLAYPNCLVVSFCTNS